MTEVPVELFPVERLRPLSPPGGHCYSPASMLACLPSIPCPATCSAPVSAFCSGSAALPLSILLLPGLAPALPTSERLFTLLSTPFSICLHSGSQQSLVQNLAASGVEHSFPGLCFQHLPYPRLPRRGCDSSEVCLTRDHVLLLLRYMTSYRCFSFLGLCVLM